MDMNQDAGDLPDGHLALTFTWPEGSETIALPLSRLERVLEGVEVGFKLSAADRTDPGRHVRLRRQVLKALQLKLGDVHGVLATVAWLAFNHPTNGAEICTGVAAAIRTTGRPDSMSSAAPAVTGISPSPTARPPRWTT